ncbi:hypothetical protein J6590_088323, partial [Homalodisca vitripennis]
MFAKLDFTGSLLNRNRRSRKRAPPKLGAKHEKKQQHATTPTLFKKNGSTETVQLEDGTVALAGRGHSILVYQLFPFGRLAASVMLTAFTGTLLNPNIT